MSEDVEPEVPLIRTAEEIARSGKDGRAYSLANYIGFLDNIHCDGLNCHFPTMKNAEVLAAAFIDDPECGRLRATSSYFASEFNRMRNKIRKRCMEELRGLGPMNPG